MWNSKFINSFTQKRKNFNQQKCLGGVGLWIFLTTIFSIGFLSENVTLAMVGSLIFGYRIWTKKIKWSPVFEWIYEAMGADLIVQQVTIMYSMELVLLIIPEVDFKFQRFLITYLIHTISFLYVVQRLPKWKLNFLYRYIYWSTITTITIFIGLFTWLTMEQFKIYRFFGIYNSGSSSKNVNCLNYLSLDGGFLLRFSILFFLQALAYYKADLDNDNLILFNTVMPRRFG